MASHLFQPLYIDTNINYNLDMSKFPGLDDPYQFFQPALLIATTQTRQEWLSAMSQLESDVCEDVTSFIDEIDSLAVSNQSPDEDLYTVIESGNLSMCQKNTHLGNLPSTDELDFLEDVLPASTDTSSYTESSASIEGIVRSNLQKLVDFQCGYISYCTNFEELCINESADQYCSHAENICFWEAGIIYKQLPERMNDPTMAAFEMERYQNACRRES